MSTFLERLKEEELELAIKAVKLSEFILTDDFKELSEGNQYLLNKQLDAMSEYLNILGTRFELNKI